MCLRQVTSHHDRFSTSFLYPWAWLFSGSGALVLTAKRFQPLFDERIAVLMLSINRAEPGNARLPLGRSRLALHVAHTSDHPTLLCSSVTFTCTHACIAYWPQGTGAVNRQGRKHSLTQIIVFFMKCRYFLFFFWRPHYIQRPQRPRPSQLTPVPPLLPKLPFP